jgi:hypothetical protein
MLFRATPLKAEIVHGELSILKNAKFFLKGQEVAFSDFVKSTAMNGYESSKTPFYNWSVLNYGTFG